MPAQMRRNGDTAIIDLEGRLALGEAVEAFRNLWTKALASGVKNIFVNLKEVTTMDSTAIGSMIRCHSAIAQHGGKLRLISANATVRQAFKVTRLDNLLEFHDSEDSALAGSGS